MKRREKTTVTLATGAFLFLTAIAPAAHAQSTMIESGNSALANVFGINAGSDSLTVSWFVVENNASGIYTYGFNIYNPVGDVALDDNGNSTGVPETFNSFNLSFDATAPGAVLSATAPVGGTFSDNGLAGLAWTFAPVSPGDTSPLLAFQSAEAPGLGNASVGGGTIPPSPWSSINGQRVPVPRQVPEPGTLGLLGLGLSFIPLRNVTRRLLGRG